MTGKVNVYFEIETINRELDFRLYLAGLCANAGVRVYVGQQDVVYQAINRSENGVYVGKNIRPAAGLSEETYNRYRVLKARGHKLIYLDEEGGVFWGERPEWEQMMLRSLDPTKLDAEDQVCTWGAVQREFYQSFQSECRDSIEVTGHPRFDLYKPRYREYFDDNVRRIKERYGNFLLVNTNFHRANTVEGMKKIFSGRVQAFTSSDRYYLLERWLHINRVLADFVTVITTLSTELPELNIVIRPHPSENVEFYRMFFGGVKNVHVSQEGSVGPWLFASLAMMHDGCTTAIEGHMCDTQVINYKTVTDERFDIPLPNLFGVRCSSPEEALEMMKKVLRGEILLECDKVNREKRDAVYAEAAKFIANFPVGQDAFEILTQKIHTTAETLRPASPIKMSGANPIFKIIGNRHGSQRKAKRRLSEGMQPKFYGFAQADIPQRIQKIQSMLNKNLQCTMLSDELLCIESN